MPDIYSSSDVARLSMDGTDAGTTFSDSLGHTFTAAGAGITTSQANARFGSAAQGNASLLTTGVSTAYLSSATTADWNMGSGNFCIDMWIYPTSLPVNDTDQLLFSIGNGTGNSNIGIGYNANGSIDAWARVGGSLKYLSSLPRTAKLQRWTHVALVRSGANLILFVNGMERGRNTTLSTTAVDFSSDLMYVAGSPNTSYLGFIGNIDELRVTKGQARFTANFVLPIQNFNITSSAISVQTIGPNTKHITINGEADHNAVMTAIVQTVTTMGWDLWDVKNDGAQVITVFRSLNKDGVSYKYALLIQEKTLQAMCLTTCEYWDKTTQTILNESYSGNRAHKFSYFAYNTTIQILANPRWFLINSFVLESTSQVCGVVEIEREAPEDVPNGIPCWGYWTTASHWGITTSWGHQYNIVPPRTFDGRTGVSAGLYQTMMFNTGAIGYGGNNNNKWAQYSKTVQAAGARYGWDLSKSNVTHFKLIEHNNIFTETGGSLANRGRLFGIKGVGPSGEIWDRVSVPCDSDGFVNTSTGTDTEHWVLSSLHESTWLKSWATSPVAHTPTLTSYNLGATGLDMAFNGQAIYVATTGDVVKVNITTGAVTTITVPGNCQGITFDGRFVYGTTSSATFELFRIDTLNADNLITLNIGVNLGSICWDGQDKLVGGRSGGTGTTPVIYWNNAYNLANIKNQTMSAKLVTTSVPQGFASNGRGTSVAIIGNGTTAADLNTIITNDDDMTASWGWVGGYSSLVSVASMQWDGYAFYANFTAAAGPQGVIMANPDQQGHLGGGTTLMTLTTSSSGMGVTTWTRVKSYRSGFGDKTVLFGQDYWFSSNSYVYQAASAPNNWSLGQVTASTSLYFRWGNYIHNMCIYQDSANSLVVMRNIHPKRGVQESSGYLTQQFLIPK